MGAYRICEPNVAKAAWNIFGKSCERRAQHSRYREARRQPESEKKNRPDSGAACQD